MTQTLLTALEPELLQIGNTGADVLKLQETLADYCFYEGAIDGIFGAQTQKAVSAVQKCFGLSEDGIFNHTTWYSLSFWSDELEKDVLKVDESISSIETFKDKVLTALKFRGAYYSNPSTTVSTPASNSSLKYRGTEYP